MRIDKVTLKHILEILPLVFQGAIKCIITSKLGKWSRVHSIEPRAEKYCWIVSSFSVKRASAVLPIGLRSLAWLLRSTTFQSLTQLLWGGF